MIEPETIKPSISAATPRTEPGGEAARRLKIYLGACALVLALFAKPLFDLVRFALDSELFSHVILIPLISGYLIWPTRKTLDLGGRAAWGAGVAAILGGLGIMAAYWYLQSQGWKPKAEDYLAATTSSFLLILLGVTLGCLGGRLVRTLSFPIGFLAFMIPFPTVVIQWTENFFQRYSADAAHGLLWLTGMPIFRVGTRFQLPGFQMEVAPECSGIHSSLVLLITSVMAGYLFLKSPWKRTVLALVVIPLALVRNGLRIAVIAQLCVQIRPEMIDSFIHRRGGPIFFALSLIPLFALLVWLRKSEAKFAPGKSGPESKT